MNIHKITAKIALDKEKKHKKEGKKHTFFLQMMMKTKLAKEQNLLKDETSVNIVF